MNNAENSPRKLLEDAKKLEDPNQQENNVNNMTNDEGTDPMGNNEDDAKKSPQKQMVSAQTSQIDWNKADGQHKNNNVFDNNLQNDIEENAAPGEEDEEFNELENQFRQQHD